MMKLDLNACRWLHFEKDFSFFDNEPAQEQTDFSGVDQMTLQQPTAESKDIAPLMAKPASVQPKVTNEPLAHALDSRTVLGTL